MSRPIHEQLRDALAELPVILLTLRRAEPPCDCPMNPHHRWNCALTPIWAQTMRELGGPSAVDGRPPL